MTLLSGKFSSCGMFEACFDGEVLYGFVTNLLPGNISGCGAEKDITHKLL